jgi:hypothetical protein
MSQHHKFVHATEKAHSAASEVIPEDKIRFRAYELYQQRDCEEGHSAEDWLQAEEEISQNSGKSKAA